MLIDTENLNALHLTPSEATKRRALEAEREAAKRDQAAARTEFHVVNNKQVARVVKLAALGAKVDAACEAYCEARTLADLERTSADLETMTREQTLEKRLDDDGAVELEQARDRVTAADKRVKAAGTAIVNFEAELFASRIANLKPVMDGLGVELRARLPDAFHSPINAAQAALSPRVREALELTASPVSDLDRPPYELRHEVGTSSRDVRIAALIADAPDTDQAA